MRVVTSDSGGSSGVAAMLDPDAWPMTHPRSGGVGVVKVKKQPQQRPHSLLAPAAPVARHRRHATWTTSRAHVRAVTRTRPRQGCA